MRISVPPWRRSRPNPRPAFALITGDLIEGHRFEGASGQDVTGQIEAFARIATASRVPIMPGLGNHDLTSYKASAAKPAADLSGAGQSRQDWARALPAFRNGVYYSFCRDVGRTP